MKGKSVFKPYIIYILGSGHSGSTILQYLLAANPDVVGIGEVRQMADNNKRNDGAVACSCGNPVQACPLWQGIQPIQGEASLDWYRQLINKAAMHYSQVTYLVDSSKSIRSLLPWLRLASEGVISGVHVIYLTRDVRGWAVSNQNARKRKKKTSRPITMSMVVWWKNQIKTMHYLKKQEAFTPLVVSYESLIFQTSRQLDRISEFCNFSRDIKSWEKSLKTSVVHDVFGNRMKNDPSARSRLTYDDRWQYRMSVNLILPFLYPVWRLNKKLRTLGGIGNKSSGYDF